MCTGSFFIVEVIQLFFVFLILINDSFIMLQKNAFGKRMSEFHARVQKCHIGNFSLLAIIFVCMNPFNFWKGKLEVACFFAI